MVGGRKLPVWIAGGVVVALAAFVYLLFFRGDSVAPVRLSEGSGAAIDDPVGTWEVVEGPNTFAGYRVREKLARLPAQSDAVGKTPDVTGSFQVSRAAGAFRISDVEIEADLTTVRSDSDRRDQRMREMGLETDRYPRATFAAQGPVRIGAEAIDGRETKLDLDGALTIHGVTKRVTVPIQAKVVGDEIEVVGSLTFPMADFSITPPSIANIVSVEPDGTMEFKVRFAMSAA
jgi:polyisoprenoid-binding protein YceI